MVILIKYNPYVFPHVVPNGNILASGSDDCRIILWNTVTYQKIITLRDHSYNVKSLCFSPDGNTLASGSWDKTIILWNIVTYKKYAILRSNERVQSICFSPKMENQCYNILASPLRRIYGWNNYTLEYNNISKNYYI